MLTNRISILSLILVFLFSSSSQLSQCSLNNDSYVNDWTYLYAEQMNPEQLQLTANFLYILYANALVDTKIQNFHRTFSQLYQKARINLSDLNNPNHELQQLKILAEKLAFLTKMRLVYTDLLDDCVNYCNEQKIAIVDAALRDLQLYASESLYIWAHEHDQEFANNLKESAKVIGDCEQSLHFVSGLHKGLSNGELPFVVEEKDKPLAVMNVILQTTPTFMHTADMVINRLNAVCDDAMKTICFGMSIYEQHYKAIYSLLAEESFDTEYATTMFNQYVLPLPDADSLFEHMIEVTELAYQSDLTE